MPVLTPAGHVRGVLALFFVTVSASLILLYAQEIAQGVAIAASGAGAVGPSADMEIWFRVAIPSAIILLALIGIGVFGEHFYFGDRNMAVTAGAFPTGIGAVALILALSTLPGVVAVMPQPAVAGGPFLLGAVLLLYAVVAEEVLLRGLLLPTLLRAWGPVAAVILSSLAFTIVHVAGGWAHPLSLVNITLAGIWFGLLALRTCGLLAPVLAHFGYNWCEEQLFGASPNPGHADLGAIADVDLDGPAVWGGSLEGLNASLVLSAVLVLLILPLALRVPRRFYDR